MNLYEAIFARKSVRSYRKEPLEDMLLTEIDEHFRSLINLFDEGRTDMRIFDNLNGRIRLRHIGSVKAPYYLIFYAENSTRSEMNMGFLMQEMVLYLTTKGLGSCYIGSRNIRRDLREKDGIPMVGLVAFGRAAGSPTRKPIDAKRKSLDEICVIKDKPVQWMNQLVEAARIAPSANNRQPWRFVVCDHRIHFFSSKHEANRLSAYEEMEFGIMFANIFTAAEELWIDVDLIRLENLTQKNFKNNRYILSAVIRQ